MASRSELVRLPDGAGEGTYCPKNIALFPNEKINQVPEQKGGVKMLYLSFFIPDVLHERLWDEGTIHWQNDRMMLSQEASPVNIIDIFGMSKVTLQELR